MRRFVDMVGQTIGLWKVLTKDATKTKRAYWVCECLSCGVTQSVSGTNLRTAVNVGGCRSCRTAGLASKHRSEYRIWGGIKTRVLNRNRHNNARYQKLGMYKPWVRDFELFFHAVGPRPSPQHSIDRIDNNKGYFPGNVRWATVAEQARNTSRNLRIGGKVLVDYAKERGIPYNTLRDRYHKTKETR